MKCIKCDTDNILTDRTANSGRCKTCNHPFAFEPTTMKGVKITDPRFKKAIDDISVNNTLFFTQTQLAYFLDYRLRRSLETLPGCLLAYLGISIFISIFAGVFFMSFFGRILLFNSILTPDGFLQAVAALLVQTLGITISYFCAISKKTSSRSRRISAKTLRIVGLFVIIIGSVITVYFVPSFFLFVWTVLLGIGAIYLGNRQLSQPPISQKFLFSSPDFQNWLRRWKEVNPEVPKLLPSPRQQLSSAVANPDVSAYSFDRLVVCDRSEIAQFLISNNFHFENNCAVLSITGYPESIFDTTMQMLHRNPNLKVFVVHDCSPKGMGLVQKLQSSDRWFKGRNVLMIDIGITPRQVLSAKNIFIQTSEASAGEAKQANRSQWQGLAPNEIKWLEDGNYVELESFTPQRLIQVINQGIAGNRDLSDSGGYAGDGGFISSSDSFG